MSRWPEHTERSNALRSAIAPILLQQILIFLQQAASIYHVIFVSPIRIIGVKHALHDSAFRKLRLFSLRVRCLNDRRRRRTELTLKRDALAGRDPVIAQELMPSQFLIAALVKEDVVPGNRFDYSFAVVLDLQ